MSQKEELDRVHRERDDEKFNAYARARARVKRQEEKRERERDESLSARKEQPVDEE